VLARPPPPVRSCSDSAPPIGVGTCRNEAQDGECGVYIRRKYPNLPKYFRYSECSEMLYGTLEIESFTEPWLRQEFGSQGCGSQELEWGTYVQ
jgi:hypothetical protein